MSIGFMLPGRDEPIIWRGPRKNGLIRQFLADVDWGELDVLVIDSPPGTSDEHLSIVTYLSKVQNMSVVLVTTPQEVALLDVRKELNFCRKVNIPIRGVVENMSSFICPHCNCSSQIFLPTTGGADKMCQEYEIPLLAKIPIDPSLVAACESGQAILKTSSPVAGVFRELARNILNN
jgi:Mrp family chromosome partitioning ATPase